MLTADCLSVILVRANRGLGLRYLSDGGRAGRGGSSVLLDRPLAGAAVSLLGFSPFAQPAKIDFFPAGAPVRQDVTLGGSGLLGKSH